MIVPCERKTVGVRILLTSKKHATGIFTLIPCVFQRVAKVRKSAYKFLAIESDVRAAASGFPIHDQRPICRCVSNLDRRNNHSGGGESFDRFKKRHMGIHNNAAGVKYIAGAWQGA